MPVYNHFVLDTQGKICGSESSQVLAVEGMLIPVVVSITEDHAQILRSFGKTVPQPVNGYALLDTGASMCAVDQRVITGLGVPAVGYTWTYGATGSQPVQTPTFPASLSFPNTNLPNISFLDFLGLPLADQGIIAIIGRAVLSTFVITYNGPAGMVTISY